MSTESKHTPGPWTIAEDRSLNDHPGVVIRIYSSDPKLAVGLVGYFNDEHEAMARADARLIAASPDLLSSLLLLHPRPGVWRTPTDEEAEQIEAIIARATGQGVG